MHIRNVLNPCAAVFFRLALPLSLSASLFPASADCGMHATSPMEMHNSSTLEAGAGFNQVAFDVAGISGTYSEFDPELRFTARPDLVFGILWPYLILEIPAGRFMGLGNPMVSVEYRHATSPVQSFAIDLQLEPPLGNTADGLAMDRFMGIGFATWHRSLGRFFGVGSIGTSLMQPGMKSHTTMDMAGMDMPGMANMDMQPAAPDNASLIHPHENWESLFRFASGVALWNGTVSPTLALSGQHVLGEAMQAGAGTDFVNVELSLPVLLARTILEPGFKIPVTSAKRFAWNLGLTARVAL